MNVFNDHFGSQNWVTGGWNWAFRALLILMTLRVLQSPSLFLEIMRANAHGGGCELSKHAPIMTCCGMSRRVLSAHYINEPLHII
jgi:hypothetical protein